jgi:hypothetical protein
MERLSSPGRLGCLEMVDNAASPRAFAARFSTSVSRRQEDIHHDLTTMASTEL